jgi:hypothetical protein
MRFLRFASAPSFAPTVAPALATARAPARTLVLLAGLMAACTPALDWREVRPDGAGLVVLLPCKPSSYARSVLLAGQAVQLSLHACSADGLTWALAFAELGDPARTTAALGELKASAMANLGATTSTARSFDLPGTTPNAASARLEFSGQLPDGKPVREQLAVFSKGTRVYQATVVGTSLPPEAVESFFGGLRPS